MIIRHNNFIREFFTLFNFVIIVVAFKGGCLIGIVIMFLEIILSINFSASIAVENEALQVYYNYLSSWKRNRVIKKEDIKSIKIKFYSKFIYSPTCVQNKKK
jgi:hypothetical protein